MKPTVGRIVHYTNLGDADGKFPPEQQAAVITAVKPKETTLGCLDVESCYDVSLVIFYKTGFFFMEAPYSKDYKRGHWT